MVLDYNQKKGPRESAERKPVQKNRPRREPAALFALLSVAALLFTFGAGVLTGRFLFRGARNPAPVDAVAQAAKKEAPAPVQPQPAGLEVPLTFYKTLPAGGKGTIGSGLNPKMAPPPLTAPRPAPAAAPVAAPPTPAPDGSAKEKQGGPARFVVQVASYRDQQEAEAARAKLAEKGVAAYLVESTLTGRGVWYRIRVGRHLTRTKAGELAGKSGKGAIVLTE
jgi:cell division protein FtsN